MSTLEGKSITTIEGIAEKGLHPVQKAWVENNVPQCGYCQPGQIMQAVSLLNSKRKVTDHEIDAVHVREHLPVWDISANSRGHQGGCEGDGMIIIENVSRRGFLQGVLSAGGFVFVRGSCTADAMGGSMLPQVRLIVRFCILRSSSGSRPTGRCMWLRIAPTWVPEPAPASLAWLPDELDADWARVKVVQALGDAKYGTRTPTDRTPSAASLM